MSGEGVQHVKGLRPRALSGFKLAATSPSSFADEPLCLMPGKGLCCPNASRILISLSQHPKPDTSLAHPTF
jgi:hypothetical protein